MNKAALARKAQQTAFSLLTQYPHLRPESPDRELLLQLALQRAYVQGYNEAMGAVRGMIHAVVAEDGGPK